MKGTSEVNVVPSKGWTAKKMCTVSIEVTVQSCGDINYRQICISCPFMKIADYASNQNKSFSCLSCFCLQILLCKYLT